MEQLPVTSAAAHTAAQRQKKPRRASATHSTVRESIWRYYICIKQKKRVRFTRYLQFITLLNIKFAGFF